MNEIIIKNYKEMTADVNSKGENSFLVKTVMPNEFSDKCYVNFVEVEPGNFAYGYHYHEENEEVFYIISGEASVKTEAGEKLLKAGDIICFPANEKGSHVIANASKTEKLVYIDFGTANRPDIVHFTGTNAGMAISKSGIYNFTK